MSRPDTPLARGRGPSTRTKLIWVVILYLAQGLPFGIAVECLPVYFRVHGVSLAAIGLMSLIGLPWSLKFLWSPLVDRFGERRIWIAGALCAMAAVMFVLPGFDAAAPATSLWTLLIAFTVASATQDVAIDAYTIGLLEPREVGIANGIRVSAYRIALILGGGGIVALAGAFGWAVLFRVAGALLIMMGVLAMRLPSVRRDPEARNRMIPTFLDWIRRPYIPVVFLFILTYKLGDAAMGPMVKPFWVDRGMSLVEIGLISTTLGVGATIAGALLGGWITSRIGLVRGLWILGLFQAISNLVYAGVAASGIGKGGIYFASLFESFSGGLGTAAFLAFLMSICDRDQAAVQYALLSALFGLTRSISGAWSGWATQQLGYASYFALTFVLALPAYALLPWVSRFVRGIAESRAAEPNTPAG